MFLFNALCKALWTAFVHEICTKQISLPCLLTFVKYPLYSLITTFERSLHFKNVVMHYCRNRRNVKKLFIFSQKYLNLYWYLPQKSNIVNAVVGVCEYLHVWQINKETRGLTYKVELIGKDPEESLTVQSEHDGEVAGHRAPHKHVVDYCPEACVKSDLHVHTHRHTCKKQKSSTVNTLWSNRQYLNIQ